MSDDIKLTTEQLDDLLKRWKRKGVEKALTYVFVGSIPLAFAIPFMPTDASPTQLFIALSGYYCALCAFALST